MVDWRWHLRGMTVAMRAYRSVFMVIAGTIATIVVVLGATAYASVREGTAAVADGHDGVVAVAAWDRRGVPAADPTSAARYRRALLVSKVRGDWRASTGQQPDLSRYRDITVDVSLADQMVYVKSAGAVIYEMVASTGMDDTTPRGTFVTNGDGGDHFYNARERMGADYWTRITGVYLFHSVPTGIREGDYIADQAVRLGEPASHGCVRLTVADAKWIYEQLPTGTKVTIA